MRGAVIASLGALIITLLLAHYTEIDLWVQELFYLRDAGRWWVDGSDPLLRQLFYTGPKGILIAVAVVLIGVVLASWWRRLSRRWLRPSLYMVLCLALIPAVVSGLKAVTNKPCPSQLTLYSANGQGQLPYRHLFEPAAATERGRCFPAGHASGGFSLLGLAFLGRQRWQRWAGASVGLAAGWVMGLYQMMKGAHFLSHTVVTLCIAWLMAVGLARLVLKTGSK
ncbi:MAG: phosphatase PAP2 family protein [Magnetococcales bacterium]|nr:phosphatase PAP2 family protein [Magnetococcales bacterium]